jgi:hypothetical protein
MKPSIIEDGKGVGWFDTETGKYEYRGEYNSVETILRRAKGFTEQVNPETEIAPYDPEDPHNEEWKDASDESITKQLRQLLSLYDDVEVKTEKQKSIQFFDGTDNVWKRRIYVDSPSDAPEWADVQQGEREGLYYETQGEAGGGQEGDAESFPQRLNTNYAVSSESLRDTDDNQKGRYASTMEVHTLENGDTIYTKAGEPDHMISEAMSDTVLDSMGVNAPMTAYNQETGEVHKEGVDGHTIGQITGAAYKFNFMIDNEVYDMMDEGVFDEDSYYEAVAGMIITGNDDLNSGNLLADDGGHFWVIDNDNLGERNMSYDPQEAAYIAESAMSYGKAMDMDVNKDELRQKVNDVAGRIWNEEEGAVTEEFNSALENAANHGVEDDPRNSTDAIKENITMNVEAAVNDELEWSS